MAALRAIKLDWRPGRFALAFRSETACAHGTQVSMAFFGAFWRIPAPRGVLIKSALAECRERKGPIGSPLNFVANDSKRRHDDVAAQRPSN
jgi:hypothetical protein